MTKEELEKEAEEWVISNTEIYDDKFGLECEEVPNPKEAYIASAEPRERRIKELEKACEETQELLDKQIEATYKLDKENAELKVENAFCEKACEGATMMYEQLTKAKVALRNVIDYLGQFCSDYPDCVIEAEKILKEE